MKKNVRSIIAVALALVLGMTGLVGCGTQGTTDAVSLSEAAGGVLVVKVNPEIEVSYDENGIVTQVAARNDDGAKILAKHTEYIGKDCNEVVRELVKAIGDAGYFVEEVEGEKRAITIEIEEGSELPTDTFLDDIVEDVRDCVKENDWKNPVDVEGESDYGYSDYQDTDYGVDSDGDTDYDSSDYGSTSNNKKPSTTKPSTTKPSTTKPSTSTNKSDYSDYNDKSDYDSSDYGSTSNNKKPSTTKPSTTVKPSTGTSDYSDYDSSDYDSNDYGDSDYDD